MLSKAEIDLHLNILLENQHPGGGFPASPTFPPYQYCWFRDGCFIAHALDLHEQSQSTRRFHQWCVDSILSNRNLMDQTRDTILNIDTLKPEACFPCRFTLDGQPLLDGWGNHQLDGLGTWLWGVSDYLRRHRLSPPGDWQRARILAADFLQALWRFPCYDCWEEHPENLHTYTLAAVHGGLKAFGATATDPIYTAAAEEIRRFVLKQGTAAGHLVKRIGYVEIDASLLGVSVPYGLVEPDSALMTQTLKAINDKLVSPSGGVHRYRADSYYGGGEWILLTGWKGWVHARRGEIAEAQKSLIFLQSAADPNGYLPEQTHKHLLSPDYLRRWVQNWGASASPLLWSHSMMLILQHSLQAAQKETWRNRSDG